MKMSQIFAKSLAACFLAIAFFAANAMAQSATVLDVVGLAQYSVSGGSWMPLAKGTKLVAGATLQTGPNGIIDLEFDNPSAVLRVSPNSTVKLEKMALLAGDAGDTETQLNLRAGEILGDVKKLSKASHYDIKTPNGVAGVSGRFHIRVERQDDGNFRVTFSSIYGEIVAAALLPGSTEPETQVLTSGESWTPGTEVVALAAPLIARWASELDGLMQQYVSTFGERTPGSFNAFTVMPSDASPIQ